MEQLEQQLYAYIDSLAYAGDVSARSRPRKNVNPKIWGPPGWKFIDKVIDGYPERASNRDQIHMLSFLTSLGQVLPCQKCRSNWADFSLQVPPKDYVSSKKDVKKWIRLYKKKAFK